jgi:peptidoglycan/xylan/chitin deacetylase (PgdA/CDA1 family)
MQKIPSRRHYSWWLFTAIFFLMVCGAAYGEEMRHVSTNGMISHGVDPWLLPSKPHALWEGDHLIAIVRGNPQRKEIALTFDDGPHPLFTLRLLALLKALHVRATFFVVGWKVDQAPWVLRRMLEDGNEIGDHTYHHFDLKLGPPELTAAEIEMCNDAVYRACGYTPLFFRPSGGQFDPAVLHEAAAHHMITVLWTDDPADYESPPANVIEDRLLHHVSPGAIILLHDGIEQTYDMLPDFVERMRREGYTFVTLREMIEHLDNAPHAERVQLASFRKFNARSK